jgi:hypothetical protein
MEEDKNLKYYSWRFLQELFEASAMILVINTIIPTSNSKGDVNWKGTLRSIFLVACITFILEEYDPEVKSQVKSGMTFTLGSSLLV